MRVLSLLFIGYCVISSAYAAEPAALSPKLSYQYCTLADLTGTWKMLQFSEVPLRKEANWVAVAPYQYLAFYTEQSYSYLAALQEIMNPQVLQRDLLWPQQAKKRLFYTLGNKGELNLYMDKKPLYSYRCFSVTAPSGVYLKNDLILMGYTLKDPRSKVYKLYRRWF